MFQPSTMPNARHHCPLVPRWTALWTQSVLIMWFPSCGIPEAVMAPKPAVSKPGCFEDSMCVVGTCIHKEFVYTRPLHRVHLPSYLDR